MVSRRVSISYASNFVSPFRQTLTSRTVTSKLTVTTGQRPVWISSISMNGFLNLDKNGTIWGFLANDIVLRNSAAWESFTARIADIKYKKTVNNMTIELSYSLQQFLAKPTVKKLSLIDCDFGG